MSLAPSSPRLPSPPPPAEIQIGPKSPSMGPNAARQAQQIEQTAMDANSKRRIHPGTKSSDMAAGPPLIPLHELDSAFQLQEHLAALHYYHTVSNTSPVTRDTAKMLATPPPGTDKTLWLYELCRFLIGQCNSLIVGFLFDTPPCSANTCPEMRASEWQFLCAVHDAPKSCCAIDYCCHTLDWAANVVTNAKIFPSRFVVDTHDKNAALKNLVNVFRRLHRIFAHAWFQHRGVFWSVEGQTGLYVFFKTVCDVYDLLPGENYKLPPEAEGLESFTSSPDAIAGESKQHGTAPTLLTKHHAQRGETEDDNNYSAARTNTKRHIKSSPSTGSAVGTVLEADEDDGSDVANRMRQLRLAEDGPGDEEMEANIPVIVDHGVVDQPPLRPASVIPAPSASSEEPRPAPEQEARTEDSQEPPAPTNQPPPEPETEPHSSTTTDTEDTQTIPIQAETPKEEDTNEPAPPSTDILPKTSEQTTKEETTKDEKPAPTPDEAPTTEDSPEAPAIPPSSNNDTPETPPPPPPEAEPETASVSASDSTSTGDVATDDASSVGSYEILEKEKEDKDGETESTGPSSSSSAGVEGEVKAE